MIYIFLIYKKSKRKVSKKYFEYYIKYYIFVNIFKQNNFLKFKFYYSI